MKSKLISWRPYRYQYKSYNGHEYEVTFTCPVCGGHNLKRPHADESNNYWEGHFVCADCGTDRMKYDTAWEKGKQQLICYYAPCFSHRRISQPKQLELFSNEVV